MTLLILYTYSQSFMKAFADSHRPWNLTYPPAGWESFAISLNL